MLKVIFNFFFSDVLVAVALGPTTHYPNFLRNGDKSHVRAKTSVFLTFIGEKEKTGISSRLPCPNFEQKHSIEFIIRD